ncbi:unnamed protein product [Agarophyton chilense]|eukprot:gb/GEZJ01002673.1/.p1 GENE.gb/GEZJ01002673.1/~~gb/GEZJ01002673.1/.p1  ORF type:complete len:655 (-),score=112.14 gb/GEZJ01002673.1/:2273-4237(-)
MATTEKVEPLATEDDQSSRRLRLLEARLNAAPTTPPQMRIAPDAPAVVPRTPPPTDEVEDVRSFSSDSMSRPATPAPVTSNVRRKYAPAPKAKMKKRKRQSPGFKSGRLDEFFKPMNDSPARKKDVSVDRSESPKQDDYAHLREMIERLKRDNETLRKAVGDAENLVAQNEDLRTQIEIEMPCLREQLEERETELQRERDCSERTKEELRSVLISLASHERREAARKASDDGERLGKPVVQRTRTSIHEAWQDGYEWKQIQNDLESIQDEKENLEKRKKELTKRRSQLQKKENAQGEEMPPPPPVHKTNVPFEDTVEYCQEMEDVCRVQMLVLKKQEALLFDMRQSMLKQRDILIREMRRQSDERDSKFSQFPVLNERYQLLNLLGRGGFSEVFKAYDLRNGAYVACKIHQLASNWKEEKKRSFIRHAMREYDIHKSLKHPRVVQLIDIFEIDENTFCTVLEYCEGSDLDSHLRAHKTLPEKEARSIVAQVCSGLLYLAEQDRRIIHYDLKPGNILLHKGEVQITDFGLSKIMTEGSSTVDVMELTSQGAGTMWYLPPECFDTGADARISVKVDVWSAGVILFQMLYGRKPFGHDQTQEKMFREKTVQHQELQFPPKPQVSDLAKDFMTKCLTRKASLRPDVRQALMHPFLRKR